MKLFLILAFAVGAIVTSGFQTVPGDTRFIAGGVDARPKELPYQLSLQTKDAHYCEASLIGHRVAVTTATCVIGRSVDDLKVVGGTIYLHRPDVHIRNQTRRVKRFVVHPNYKPGYPPSNDIALLFFHHGFLFNHHVKPIAIPTQISQTPGNLLVSGWGFTTSGGGLSNVLKKVQIPFISDADCRSVYGTDTILDSMLCAGAPAGDKGPCNGDVGAPLKSLETGKLLGISIAIDQCDQHTPGIYTEVSYFHEWIEEETKKQHW